MITPAPFKRPLNSQFRCGGGGVSIAIDSFYSWRGEKKKQIASCNRKLIEFEFLIELNWFLLGDFEVAPLVKAETQLLGAPVGSQIVLKCIIESYPPSINIWMKGRHQDHTMLLDGWIWYTFLHPFSTHFPPYFHSFSTNFPPIFYSILVNFQPIFYLFPTNFLLNFGQFSTNIWSIIHLFFDQFLTIFQPIFD